MRLVIFIFDQVKVLVVQQAEKGIRFYISVKAMVKEFSGRTF